MNDTQSVSKQKGNNAPQRQGSFSSNSSNTNTSNQYNNMNQYNSGTPRIFIVNVTDIGPRNSQTFDFKKCLS